MQRGPRAVKSTEAALCCTPPPLCCFMQCWEVCTCNTCSVRAARLIQPEVNKLPEPSSPFKCFLTTHLYCFVFSSFTKMPAGLHSASFIALFPLIYARWSYLTWFYFLPRAPRRPRWVLLLQVHRSRAEHNAGGKILDCKRDTKVHLPAITCTIPRLLPN